MFERSDIPSILEIDAEDWLDVYLQIQMIMTLRGFQLAETGEQIGTVWPDYGRFHDFRVKALLDRTVADPQYGSGLASVFGLDHQTFVHSVGRWVADIPRNWWGGSGYMWESIKSWSPTSPGN